MSFNRQERPVWYADLGNGRFRNPILYADYSDPDVIRVGEDFYMTASSFTSLPGLPVLHSKDLVNWTLLSHAIQDELPGGYDTVRHGDGVWAPSIRHHDGKFWIYFSAPDEGIYMTTAADPAGPWTPLHLVKAVKGWIDPCPLWDDDGQAYLIHAFANSRCGIKHKLQICRMSVDGKALLDDGSIVYDGTLDHPTLEGPKLYKRSGYYYIFAPAGGVPTGWQTIFRSRHIMGPYEDTIVLHQGDSVVNGPHQGGFVELDSGESWFVHFQDRGAYGRIIHLQPMRWEEDWPVMGVDTNGDGIGEPVLEYRKPDVGREWPFTVPETSDEFDGPAMGLQWQWQANRKPEWASLAARPGHLRLFAGTALSLYEAPNVLCQKLPAPGFTAGTKLDFAPGRQGERAGLTVFGHQYRYIAIESVAGGTRLVFVHGTGGKESSAEETAVTLPLPEGIQSVYFRVQVELEAQCTFEYSLDGERYAAVGEPFAAVPGGWVGAKLGLFCLRFEEQTAAGTVPAEGGYADFDWFRFA